MSCPPGKSILYLTTPIPASNQTTRTEAIPDPEALLRPYLDATLLQIKTRGSSQADPIFTIFFIHTMNTEDASAASQQEQNILICPLVQPHVTMAGDAAAASAESIFWQAVDCLGMSGEVDSFWPPSQLDPDDDDEM